MSQSGMTGSRSRPGAAAIWAAVLPGGGTSPMKNAKQVALCALFLMLARCSTVPRSGPNFVPPGAHRVAQIAALAKRSEIVGTPMYQLMIDGGVSDTQIVDNSEAAGIVYCCGRSHSLETAVVFYVSPVLKLRPGDIVEIRMGGEHNGSQYGTVNTGLTVRENVHDFGKQCRWLPHDDHEGTSTQLWGRILYCDWMQKEGWTEKETIEVHTWFKSP